MLVVPHLRWPEREGATFGKLVTPAGRQYHTLELPWRDNHRNVSCWPAGPHACRLTYSPKFGVKLYLVDVVRRAGCRIHAANLVRQLRGCLAVGRKIARFPNGDIGVTNSKSSLDDLMDELGGRDFTLATMAWTTPWASLEAA